MSSQDSIQHKIRPVLMVEMAAAVVLVIAFLLPWFSNPAVTASGYNITKWIRFFPDLSPISTLILILVYLIPAAGISLIVNCVFRPISGAWAMVTAMLPTFVFIILYFQCPFILPQARIGVFLTAGAALVLLFTGACHELLVAKHLQRDQN